MTPFLGDLHAKMESVNKSISREDYEGANVELDRFFELYKKSISSPKFSHVENLTQDDSGLKIVHAEMEISRGNMKGGVLEKLSVAKGDLDYFIYICEKSAG